MKIKDIKTALEVFEDASLKQSVATEQGDYKTGNKYYSKVIEAAAFLKGESAINLLKDCLHSPIIGVRLWAACYWLAVNEREAIKVLTEIKKTDGIHSLTAETTIREWKKGNLEF